MPDNVTNALGCSQILITYSYLNSNIILLLNDEATRQFSYDETANSISFITPPQTMSDLAHWLVWTIRSLVLGDAQGPSLVCLV